MASAAWATSRTARRAWHRATGTSPGPSPASVPRSPSSCSCATCVLDGEIVCLGPDGRALFDTLFYRRAEPYLYAFDLLWLDGCDLRSLPLIERNRVLRGLVPCQPSWLLYADHVDGHGVDLFREVCRQDLEGIVAKRRDGLYDPDAPTWIKIKNPAYSQAVGRHERFGRMRAGA